MIDNTEIIALLTCLSGILVPVYLMFMHDWHLLSDRNIIKYYSHHQESNAYFNGEMSATQSTLFKLKTLANLPDFTHRYVVLLMLVSVYGSVFYILAALGFDGFFSDGMGVNSAHWTVIDYIIPVTALATLAMVLFGYIMQADNCLFLRQEIQFNLTQSNQALGGEYAEEMQVNRTFRAISVGQIMPGIYMPMAVLLWSLHGAWLFSVWDIVLRAIDDSLSPHVFVLATMRLALAALTAVALFSILQGFFGIYKREPTGGSHHIISICEGKEKWANYMVAAAIFVGFTPMQSIETLAQQLDSQFGISTSFSHDSSHTPLYKLRGISSLHIERLSSLGILDVHQLAYIGEQADVLARRSGIQVEQIKQWANQAQLIIATGNDKNLQAELHRMGINNCSFLARILHQQYIQKTQGNGETYIWHNMTKDEQTLRFLTTSSFIYQDIYTEKQQAKKTDILRDYCTQIN